MPSGLHEAASDGVHTRKVKEVMARPVYNFEANGAGAGFCTKPADSFSASRALPSIIR